MKFMHIFYLPVYVNLKTPGLLMSYTRMSSFVHILIYLMKDIPEIGRAH